MNKTITLIDVESGMDSFPPKNLMDFHKWIDDYMYKIPAEYRRKAKISITALSGYEIGDETVNIIISYDRPETKEEEQERIKHIEREEGYTIAKEKRQLARLKKKYES